MPQYTFVCANDHEKVTLCKYSERETLEEQCDECGEPMRWRGVELVQRRDFQKGKYRLNAIMSDGTKTPVNNIASPKKRSDS